MSTELPTYVRPYSHDENGVPLGDREDQKPKHERDITNSGLIAAVRRAYRDTEPNQSVDTDGSRRLNFHAGWRDSTDGTLLTAIGFIGKYNRFDPEYVQDAVESMPGETYVSIGRESSPVMYFYTDEPFAVVNSLESIDGGSDVFDPAGPDELSVSKNAKLYPHSGQYGYPEPDKFGETVWSRHNDSDSDLLRFEDNHCLVRAWWD